MKNLIAATYPPLTIALSSTAAGMVLHGVLWILLTLFTALMWVDVFGRARDYLYLKSQPEEWFTVGRIASYRRTWCGRTVMVAAYPPSWIVYYQLGYRWYHVCPDGFWKFNKRHPLISKNWWLSFIGVRTQ